MNVILYHTTTRSSYSIFMAQSEASFFQTIRTYHASEQHTHLQLCIMQREVTSTLVERNSPCSLNFSLASAGQSIAHPEHHTKPIAGAAPARAQIA